jgi:hypothetical protein
MMLRTAAAAAAAAASLMVAASATPAVVSMGVCPETPKPGYSIYKGGVLVASTNVTDQASCCALCHTSYHDECVGWEWIDTQKVRVHGHRVTHNCDIFAKVGPPTPGWPGRVAGYGANAPPPAPPPEPKRVGAPCHSDGDCAAGWGGDEWRCLEHRGAPPSLLNSCHMHATTKNTTCACQSSGCGGGWTEPRRHQREVKAKAAGASTRYLVIGDSISTGMQPDLAALLKPSGWLLSHNPGNGDNTNYGAHCVPAWTSAAGPIYDVISFQFGLHDIAYDEERLSVQQYSALLTNITAHLIALQRAHGTKLLWVRTTPVPTVATYGHGCNGSATVPSPEHKYVDMD